MTDFSQLTTEEIDAFLVEHQHELDMGGIEPGDVTTRVENGSAVVEAREYGFAILQLTEASGGLVPHLWALYIDPDRRGRRMGMTFLRYLLKKYARKYCMSLVCHGPRRRAFFGRAGFCIESKDGEYRRMTTADRETRLRLR